MKRTFAILIVAALSLSACAYWGKDKRGSKFVKCPQAEMLAAGQAWITPPGDGWKARAQISEYNTQCKITKTSAIFTVTPKVLAERSGDVLHEAKQDLPLFLAVMRGSEIIQKKIFTDTVKFGSGDKTVEDNMDMQIELPFGDAGTAADRTVVLAFQLDGAQLDYFRALRDARAKASLQKAAAPVPATK